MHRSTGVLSWWKEEERVSLEGCSGCCRFPLLSFGAVSVFFSKEFPDIIKRRDYENVNSQEATVRSQVSELECKWLQLSVKKCKWSQL